MPTFTYAAGHTVAADVRNVFSGIDGALLNTARLTVSLLEASEGADLSAAKGQKVLESVAAGFNKVVEGRKEIMTAHRALTVIKGESNLSVVDYGCLGSGPLASAADVPASAA
ncbi:hypothetical protein [Sphingobium phenoxybenzoativorans]|uniref:hypothetical protein n=1 Tax=Sphingobium phenoxybenzoativorans TaxID=1592790 RepID=UPI000871B965|nr:hypothetical protein [Sphingobium phenoxybenzoativorans]